MISFLDDLGLRISLPMYVDSYTNGVFKFEAKYSFQLLNIQLLLLFFHRTECRFPLQYEC